MPEHFYAAEGSDLGRLLSMGFSANEAERLIHMKDHVSDHAEYRELVAESRRLDFVRWLIEHDRLSR
ncbi:MAG: hypothetical protein NVSMB38_00930 [Ktedonobacteraceae bacterium]